MAALIIQHKGGTKRTVNHWPYFNLKWHKLNRNKRHHPTVMTGTIRSVISKLDYMNNESSKNKKKVGRKPKIDKAIYKYAFRLTEVENAKFLSLFDQSELSNKAEFSKRCIFDNEIKVMYYNKSVHDFYMKLTHFYSQFRAIETNYNQIVKILYRHFPERKLLLFSIDWRNKL